MSAGHDYVGGTRGSGIVSNAADMLGVSVVRGMKGVGEVCEMCMCLAWDGVGGVEGGGVDVYRNYSCISHTFCTNFIPKS